MRVIFARIATQELEDAVRFYDFESAGLGQRFKEEMRKAALRIAEYPQAWSIERGEVRKCLLHKFPYKLLYSVGRVVASLIVPQSFSLRTPTMMALCSDRSMAR